MNIYLINYSTEYEVEGINEDFQASIDSEFEEVTKDWNDDVRQAVIDKVNKIVEYAYEFDEESKPEFKWVEEEWFTLDTKFSYNRIYGQINRKKIIKCLDNENKCLNNENYIIARIVVYEIEL